MNRFTKFLLLAVILTLVLLLLFGSKLKRLQKVNTLFDAECIQENFQDAEEIFDVSELPASTKPHVLPTNLHYNFPKSFNSSGQTISTEEFLEKTQTEGLLVIHMDTIIYESYHLGLEQDETHISWSMSKSFISTLMGMAVDKGLLTVQDTILKFLPEFKDTGYAGTTVENLLQMSSGVAFNEDYGDYHSDINRFGRTFAMGTSFKKFAMSLKNEKTPGSYCHYVSIDTQVLGLLLAKVTGKSLTVLLHEWIWEPLGMETEAQWIIDDEGSELGLGGMNASLRDYAKLGLLYLNDGVWQGKQILSKEWIEKATTPHAPHLMPNQTEKSSHLYGYGYQWWTPQFPKNDFFATGIYDQFVYVNREKDLVIAKLSADYHYKTGRKSIKSSHIEFFQSVAESF